MSELANKLDKISSGLPINHPCSVIEDLSDALDFATGQCLDGKEDWTDLRENQSAEVLGQAYKIDGGSELLDVIFKHWESFEYSLPDRFITSGANNEIEADFLFIAKSEKIKSISSSFFAMLLDFYKAGYWPCGWEGDYPNGKLLVHKINT